MYIFFNLKDSSQNQLFHNGMGGQVLPLLLLREPFASCGSSTA